jgi:hypothetical protein
VENVKDKLVIASAGVQLIVGTVKFTCCASCSVSTVRLVGVHVRELAENISIVISLHSDLAVVTLSFK